MKNIIEQTKLGGEIEYPQISYLPRGIRFVKQDGFPQTLKHKYWAFLNNTCFGVNGRNLKDAKQSAKEILNSRLRMTKLTYGESITQQEYNKVFGITEPYFKWLPKP